MPDERYSIKIANNYGRFAAIITVYEYFINEEIKHDEENFHEMSFGFHYVINDIFKNINNDVKETTENKDLVVYKDGKFKKLINFIKSFLKLK